MKTLSEGNYSGKKAMPIKARRKVAHHLHPLLCAFQQPSLTPNLDVICVQSAQSSPRLRYTPDTPDCIVMGPELRLYP